MRKAFSLMELMIVIIILGLLASLIMPNLLGKSEQARQKLACVQMNTLSDSLKMFKADFGSFPTTEEGILALVNNPNPDAYKNYPDGGYLDSKTEPKDPWGNLYIYVLNENDFEIISLGADGKEGGDEANKDINYPQCKE